MFGYNRYKIDWENDLQETRMLKVLSYYQNKEINVWRLINDTKIAQYTTTICDLRQKGYIINNRIENVGNIKHSFYKLINTGNTQQTKK